jgi:hypothetical protein
MISPVSASVLCSTDALVKVILIGLSVFQTEFHFKIHRNGWMMSELNEEVMSSSCW